MSSIGHETGSCYKIVKYKYSARLYGRLLELHTLPLRAFLSCALGTYMEILLSFYEKCFSFFVCKNSMGIDSVVHVVLTCESARKHGVAYITAQRQTHTCMHAASVGKFT